MESKICIENAAHNDESDCIKHQTLCENVKFPGHTLPISPHILSLYYINTPPRSAKSHAKQIKAARGSFKKIYGEIK